MSDWSVLEGAGIGLPGGQVSTYVA